MKRLQLFLAIIVIVSVSTWALKAQTKPITYHLPDSKWNECSFASKIEKAPKWDGHTSNDILERLKQL